MVAGSGGNFSGYRSPPVGFHRELLDLLRWLRASHGNPTLRSVARKAGVALGTCSNVLAGRTLPRPTVAQAIARALGGSEAEQSRAAEYADRAAVHRRGTDGEVAGGRPISPQPASAANGVFLDKFTVNGALTDVTEGANRVHAWLRAVGDQDAFVTGLRICHVRGVSASMRSGALAPDARYSFTFRSGEGPIEHLLEPALVINPRDREVVNFELWLTPEGRFGSSGGELYVTLLYHLSGGDQGELPLVRPTAPWRLLGRLTGDLPALRFPGAHGVSLVFPTGAVRGTAPAFPIGVVHWPGQFRYQWLAQSAFAPNLREATTDSDPQIRLLAVQLLGQLRDAGGIDELVHALRDHDANVQFHSLSAIERIGPSNATAAVLRLMTAEHTTDSVRRQAARTLVAIGDDTVPQELVALRDHPNPRVQTEAAFVRDRLSSRK